MYKARGDNRTHCKCKLKVRQKIDSSIMYEKENKLLLLLLLCVSHQH